MAAEPIFASMQAVKDRYGQWPYGEIFVAATLKVFPLQVSPLTSALSTYSYHSQGTRWLPWSVTPTTLMIWIMWCVS